MEAIDFYSLPVDDQYAILEKKNAVEMKKAMHFFDLESALMVESEESFLLESEEYDLDFEDEEEEEKKNTNPSGKKYSVFAKICNAIRNFINSFVNMVKNMFKDSVDWDEYKKSDEMEVRYNQDVERITDQVNHEMAKGRKIVQMISRKSGVDDATVANFCDMGAKVVMDNSSTVINTASGWMIKKKVLDSMDKSKKIIDESQKNLEKSNLSKKDAEKGMKILNTMNKMVTGLGKSTKGLLNKFKNKKGVNKNE